METSAKIVKNFFLPSFPMKFSKKALPISQKKARPNLKVSTRISQELNLLQDGSASSNRVTSYRNQNDFCELKSLIMTPLRLRTLEICLPSFESIINNKSGLRGSYTSKSRRKSVESKGVGCSPIEIPAEIVAKKCTPRVRSANPRMKMNKGGNQYTSKSSGLSKTLSRRRTFNSTNYCSRKAIGNDERNKPDSNFSSPIGFMPIYSQGIEST